MSADTELLEAVLGLLVNISSDPTDALREFGQRICGYCHSLLSKDCTTDTVTERAVTVLSNLLPHSIPAVEWICNQGGTSLLLTYVKVCVLGTYLSNIHRDTSFV